MTFIKIKDSVYQVRIYKNKRQIKVNDMWLDSTDFVDHLANNSKWSELAELANLGYNQLHESI